MVKRISLVIVSLLLIIIVGISVGCAKSAQPTAAWTPPKLVSVVGCATDTATYANAIGIMTAITEKTGVEARVEPQNTSMARFNALRTTSGAEPLVTMGVEMYNAVYGEVEFNVKDWGPQPIRMIWNGGTNTIAPVVRADSGIKTWADVKGKRVCVAPAYPLLTTGMTAWLAFGGLTLNDVKPIEVSAYGPGIVAVKDGSSDVAYAGPNSAPAIDLAASSHSAAWLQLPLSDKAGWDRLFKVTRMFFPGVEYEGAGGISKEKPLEGTQYTYGIVAYPEMDDNLAYWITKQVNENYDGFKGRHVLLKRWTLDLATSPTALIASGTPYHEGSVKYFKEIGRWTPELEKIQKELLALQSNLRTNWEKAHPGW